MALLLEEASKLSQDQYRSGIIEVFVQNAPVLQMLDFLNIAGNAYKYNMEGSLPGVAFRGVNESYTPSTGVINPQTESLRISGGELDVDTHILRTRGEGVRSAHEALKIKALARSLNEAIFKGDSSADPREFDGLNRRLTGTQEIVAGSGGGALTIDMLDDLLATVPEAGALLCGAGAARLMTKLLRGNTQVSIGQDAFGKPLTMYNGIPIINVGKKADNTEILAFDEDDGSGNLDTTSIYAVRFGNAGAESDFFGLQNSAGMIVTDLGELDSKPAKRTRVEWDISMVLASSDCAARLKQINNAIA